MSTIYVLAFAFSLICFCYFHHVCCAQLPATRAAISAFSTHLSILLLFQLSFWFKPPFFHIIYSNPLALSTVMHILKADRNYLCEEVSCASLLSQHCEHVSLALFHTLSFPQVYGPLGIIRKGVEMLFESLLVTHCFSAAVHGFTE